MKMNQLDIHFTSTEIFIKGKYDWKCIYTWANGRMTASFSFSIILSAIEISVTEVKDFILLFCCMSINIHIVSLGVKFSVHLHV